MVVLDTSFNLSRFNNVTSTIRAESNSIDSIFTALKKGLGHERLRGLLVDGILAQYKKNGDFGLFNDIYKQFWDTFHSQQPSNQKVDMPACVRPNTSDTLSEAVAQAFQTVGLVYLTFEFLDLKSLLSCSKVNRQFSHDFDNFCNISELQLSDLTALHKFWQSSIDKDKDEYFVSKVMKFKNANFVRINDEFSDDLIDFKMFDQVERISLQNMDWTSAHEIYYQTIEPILETNKHVVTQLSMDSKFLYKDNDEDNASADDSDDTEEDDEEEEMQDIKEILEQVDLSLLKLKIDVERHHDLLTDKTSFTDLPGLSCLEVVFTNFKPGMNSNCLTAGAVFCLTRGLKNVVNQDFIELETLKMTVLGPENVCNFSKFWDVLLSCGIKYSRVKLFEISIHHKIESDSKPVEWQDSTCIIDRGIEFLIAKSRNVGRLVANLHLSFNTHQHKSCIESVDSIMSRAMKWSQSNCIKARLSFKMKHDGKDRWIERCWVRRIFDSLNDMINEEKIKHGYPFHGVYEKQDGKKCLESVFCFRNRISLFLTVASEKSELVVQVDPYY